MDAPIRLLLVEDVATDAELAQRELKRAGLDTHMLRVETREQLLEGLASFKPDVVISDFSLPHFDGKSALAVVREVAPQVPFLFLSGTIGEESAIDALKDGAADYVLKTNPKRLAPAVRRALEDATVRRARIIAEDRFRDLIEFAPDAIILLDQLGHIALVNARCIALSGHAREQLVGQSGAMLATPDMRQELERTYASYLGEAELQRAPGSLEIDVMKRDGTHFPAEMSVSPLQSGNLRWLAITLRDITEHKAQQERIERLSRIHAVRSGINGAIVRIRDRYLLLHEACDILVDAGQFSAAWIGLFDTATQTVRPMASAGFEGNYLRSVVVALDAHHEYGKGLGAQALRSLKCLVINDVATDANGPRRRKALQAQNFQSVLATALTIGGGPAGLLVLYSKERDVFNDAEQALLKGLAADLSYALEHIGKEERLQHLAYFDALTDLPNRTLFADRLAQLLKQDSADGPLRIALVLLDIERFRHINDTLGREAGDALLREVARRIQQCVLDSRYVARVGTDLFAFAIVENGRGTGVANLLEGKLATALAEPIVFAGLEVRVTVKAGVAMYPHDGRKSETLMRNCEAALKNAKAWNQRYLFYTPEMNARTAEKLSLENRLRRALELQEFVLHYQPKIDRVSGRVVGLEGLLRWAEGGPAAGALVAPDSFIAVLEETGLIVDVGLWVLREAVRQHAAWSAMGLRPPRIAVNVSPMQIHQKDFTERVLAEVGAEALQNLEIEITESIFMDAIESNVSKLSALRAAGATVAVDDFGTGFSSLSTIAQLPIDTLKIDQSFVRSMVTSRDHKAIVSTVIALATALELTVVAEGVETAAEASMLDVLGCDQLQGYLYSRPVTADQVPALLGRTWNINGS